MTTIMQHKKHAQILSDLQQYTCLFAYASVGWLRSSEDLAWPMLANLLMCL